MGITQKRFDDCAGGPADRGPMARRAYLPPRMAVVALPASEVYTDAASTSCPTYGVGGDEGEDEGY